MELQTHILKYEEYIKQICSKDIDEIDAQISPSRWVRRMPADEVIAHHLKLVAEKNKSSKKFDVKTLSYGAGAREKFDIISSNQQKGEYLLIFLHGGYWQALNKECYHWLSEIIVEDKGIAIFIGYDLAPKASLDVIVDQVERAITTILRLAGSWNIQDVYIGGHSAGAHLAFMGVINMEDPQLRKLVKGFWLVSGVHDLRPLAMSSENKALNLTQSRGWTLSPLNAINISRFVELFSKSRMHIWTGEDDPPIFRKQSTLLHQALQSSGCASSFYEAKNKDHFSIIEDCTDHKNDLSRELLKIFKVAK